MHQALGVKVEPRDLPLLELKRVAPSLLGDGYVELIPDSDLISLSKIEMIESHGRVCGEPVRVRLPEAPTIRTVGRFGWKAQHGSLLSASADALHGELGVANYLFPSTRDHAIITQQEQQSPSQSEDLNSILEFIRSTPPITPDSVRADTKSVQEGAAIFVKIDCSICHRVTLQTAPSGTAVVGGTVTVPSSMGNVLLHPYSDFLLHDVGTGDLIGQSIFPEDFAESTRNKFRTAPLWGVRFRSWLMHDGKSVTYHQAIMRHAGEASSSVDAYVALTPIEKEHLRQFLDTL